MAQWYFHERVDVVAELDEEPDWTDGEWPMEEAYDANSAPDSYGNLMKARFYMHGRDDARSHFMWHGGWYSLLRDQLGVYSLHNTFVCIGPCENPIHIRPNDV